VHAEGQLLLWVFVQLLALGERLGDHAALLDALGLIVATADHPAEQDGRHAAPRRTRWTPRQCHTERDKLESFQNGNTSCFALNALNVNVTLMEEERGGGGEGWGGGRGVSRQGVAAGDSPAPGAPPDEDGGLGPHPGAHGDAGPEHGEQVDLLHHQAGPVLDDALWDRLVGLRGDRHVGLAAGETRLNVIVVVVVVMSIMFPVMS